MWGPDAERLASTASRRTVSILKLANVYSGNSKEQCHCIAVRTIQPAVRPSVTTAITEPRGQPFSATAVPTECNRRFTPPYISVQFPPPNAVHSFRPQTSRCSFKRQYTGCHRRNGPNFGRVFLMLNYTDITQNTYIQS